MLLLQPLNGSTVCSTQNPVDVGGVASPVLDGGVAAEVGGVASPVLDGRLAAEVGGVAAVDSKFTEPCLILNLAFFSSQWLSSELPNVLHFQS